MPEPGAPPVIENPILNGPFSEPTRHFRFDDLGITPEVEESRRVSSYFMPIAQPRRMGKQLRLETEWTRDRLQENKRVNRIRQRVGQWRTGGYVGVTQTTARLLEYWNNPSREKKLFFCQIEAVETAIYITEVAKKYGDAWIENELREENDLYNGGLPRLALKMATGSGKTVVMAMLIAWQALNKLEHRQDARFSDAFLLVTPGITIRDRLRVLLPNDPDNYYRQRDILPAHLLEKLGAARILITNYHAFLLHEGGDASKLTKSILVKGGVSPFKETPDQMVRRVCRDLGTARQIVVINDEAHHCYRGKADTEAEVLTAEERAEAKEREKEARVWISGLDAVRAKLGLKAVYDLSATPFFLRGSGYSEGTLFPWVVSDFSLIDAIESGIVKVPRVPVSDNAGDGELPTYRDLWQRIRDELPKKRPKDDAGAVAPNPPVELEAALKSLYSNYTKAFAKWEANTEARARGLTSPVFVVVCNSTAVSKMVFDHVAGWEKPLPNGESVIVPGGLPLFSNEQDGRWTSRPVTILVDSRQLESGEGLSPEFKKIAATEIEEFKAEYRARFPGRNADDLTDEDLLREVMNTVGKAGKLGEHVRCVVSVSMLTEGWDANTVTHILGVRAFGTQLLCEQVVGRGLRRMSYAVNADGHFEPEYAEVYGVPFSFISTAGTSASPTAPVSATRVRALDDRAHLEISFPRLTGYRYDLGSRRLAATFGPEHCLALSTEQVPVKVVNAPIVGEQSIHTLEELKQHRPSEVAFLLAKLTLEKYFRADGESRTDRSAEHHFDAEVQSWLFPQVLAIAKSWMAECLTCKDHAFPQMLLLVQFAHDAADRIYKAIVASDPGTPRLRPILQPWDQTGSTRGVDFDTTKSVFTTAPDRCHVSHVVEDSGWEGKLAQTLEDMPEVVGYVKNQGLDFTIPYTINGAEKRYHPDFVVRMRVDGQAEPVNLVLEVSGQQLKEKAAKVTTAQALWVPAVNNHGAFGRWAFAEITDPWNAEGAIRAAARMAVDTAVGAGE